MTERYEEFKRLMKDWSQDEMCEYIDWLWVNKYRAGSPSIKAFQRDVLDKKTG